MIIQYKKKVPCNYYFTMSFFAIRSIHITFCNFYFREKHLEEMDANGDGITFELTKL
jgi:hypothetical protein